MTAHSNRYEDAIFLQVDSEVNKTARTFIKWCKDGATYFSKYVAAARFKGTAQATSSEVTDAYLEGFVAGMAMTPTHKAYIVEYNRFVYLVTGVDKESVLAMLKEARNGFQAQKVLES